MSLLPLAAALAAVSLFLACGDGGLSLEEGLRRMVLQPEDLPEGFVQRSESFTSNDDAAAGSAERKAQLESWGRVLGFEVVFEPSQTARDRLPVRGINVSASLYETEAGADESFADAVKTAMETDWAANYSGLRGFEQKEIEVDAPADEIVWLRLSGFEPAPGGGEELVTDDLVFFREGRERGFLRVQAIAGDTEERGHYQSTVKGWLEALVANVIDTLPQIKDGD